MEDSPAPDNLDKAEPASATTVSINTPADDPSQYAAALEQVVDDFEIQASSLAWVTDELLKGRSTEDLQNCLVDQGWTSDEASNVVEQARRATRRLRGVITREDVVIEANRNYRKSMTGGWFLAFPSLNAAFRLLYSLGNLITLGKMRRRR